MKARYWFWYGVTFGLLTAVAMSTLLDNSAIGWMLIVAAMALAIALVIHQRSTAEKRGRRWRRTWG